jgi:hypothetical protein
MSGGACFFIRGEKIEKSRSCKLLLFMIGMSLDATIVKSLMNLAAFGIQGRAYFGGGVELESGSGNSANPMRYNKKGHMFRYNNLQSILSRHQRRYYLCARINITIS